ncbi:TatD family deoxyribonuclease [Parablautia intestinalis]|uniref:TatD family deoxyribonuclease n=1 Tax=Parablautia intestinalis TaxID=2320100 RepID=A0A3A9AL36_9FIRM|nr:TatD family hydrolase [Parablautia intestinalis]RKI92038.1 TatD family deoxyribonuclease [Parablautia intestinalis]
MIFDTHAHYDDEAFDTDRDELLKDMWKNGVEFVVNVGASIESSKKALKLAETYSFIYAAIGVHPSETGEMTEEDIVWLERKAADSKVTAIGEIGLDYYWKEPDKDIQKKWFERQLWLAGRVKLPVIIHSRDAAKDTLEILKSWKKDKTAGVIHCYSYTKESAREYLDMDYYFGIGGVVTFKNARKLTEAVSYIPMNRILLETDCPYLAPEPYRGKRNQSSYIDYVAQKISEIKQISKEEVLVQTMQNAKDFYSI